MARICGREGEKIAVARRGQFFRLCGAALTMRRGAFLELFFGDFCLFVLRISIRRAQLQCMPHISAQLSNRLFGVFVGDRVIDNFSGFDFRGRATHCSAGRAGARIGGPLSGHAGR